MEWKSLLSATRLGSSGPDGDFRSPFQRDFDRIIFCSALRRLQDKTQVFPLAKNDYVRTRLTHSLEVSSVGRSLAFNIGTALKNKYGFSELHPYYFGEIVAAACLAHDIGNPPFGHSGEDAISAWFKKPENQEALAGLSQNQKAEFQNFEGNAQGFRVLCTLQKHNRGSDRFGGLQLTHATLGAFLKYPRRAFLDACDKRRISHKKYNYFETEADDFLEVVQGCGLLETVAKESYARHPLVFLVEAADDISYTIADLQDGFRLGLVPYEKIRDFLLDILKDRGQIIRKEIRNFSDNKDKIEHLAGKAIGQLVKEISEVFLEHEEGLLKAEMDQPLTALMPSQALLKQMFEYAHQNIYTSPEVVNLKLAGFTIISGLLDIFVPAVCFHTDKQNYNHHKHQLVLRLIPGQFMEDIGLAHTAYEKLHRITDYIAGMTDSYAVRLYRKLHGIAVD